MTKVYKCESCGHESTQYKKRFVGRATVVGIYSAKACRKCNWFLTEDEEEKELVMSLYKSK